ncbi:MAG: hypothetical protein A2201_05280 [Alicyclobacillus sp. RIFOXYA1_FULL_53_8]|nr:MAG: hypothetical protein A2201_05280 [Alicyclobacillus sp. RIFOXYA1_FULL_53_8]
MTGVYLVCFLVGLILTIVVSLTGGMGHGGHSFLHIHFGPAGADVGGGHGTPGPLNLPTLLGFLTGFGGCGYALTQLGFRQGVLVLFIALVVGLGIGGLLFFVLIKLFVQGERIMHESDYELRGMLGYVSVRIPEQGVGEVKYVLDDTTRSIGARSEFGVAVDKSTEVVILEVNKGIATVTAYDELVHGNS